MSSDIDKRLRALNARRQGRDRATHTFDAVASMEAYPPLEESYQKRSTREHTRYALGAMQEVDRSYTDNGIKEAERVQAQIATRMSNEGLSCSFRLQGSVPGNIHIRGASDVDFLVLEPRFHHYDPNGSLALRGHYTTPYRASVTSTLLDLRERLETVLKEAFPAVEVDCAGAKAIQLSGGSLRRDIDVVPASWNDTIAYQASRDEDFRGVNIIDKYVPELIHNLPFLHLRRLKERDLETWGGLKKAIRLCKTLKADAIEDGRQVEISSYDIASALWNAEAQSLQAGIVHELSILAAVTNYFVYLTANPNYARELQTPDGTRKVFDSQGKIDAISVLTQELLDLSRNVSAEQSSFVAPSSHQTDWLGTLRRTEVPLAG